MQKCVLIDFMFDVLDFKSTCQMLIETFLASVISPGDLFKFHNFMQYKY